MAKVTGGGEIGVQFEGVFGGAGDLVKDAQAMEAAIMQVQRDLEALGGAWTGKASAQFQSLMQKWNTDVKNLNTTLEEVARNVKVAGNKYEELETAIAQGFTPA